MADAMSRDALTPCHIRRHIILKLFDRVYESLYRVTSLIYVRVAVKSSQVLTRILETLKLQCYEELHPSSLLTFRKSILQPPRALTVCRSNLLGIYHIFLSQASEVYPKITSSHYHCCSIHPRLAKIQEIPTDFYPHNKNQFHKSRDGYLRLWRLLYAPITRLIYPVSNPGGSFPSNQCRDFSETPQS